MAVLYENSASISTTEYSLPNNTNYNSSNVKTDTGSIQLWLDLNTLIAGDQFELKIYEKVVSGGTVRLVDTWVLDGPQAKPHQVFMWLGVEHGWDYTLKRIAGADRTIAWSIRRA